MKVSRFAFLDKNMGYPCCFATSFWAKNGVCRFWGLLSHIVEEEFGLFLGFE